MPKNPGPVLSGPSLYLSRRSAARNAPGRLAEYCGALGRTVAIEVQIFGTKKCTDTRKAQRFFAERRVRVHFVDLQVRAASLGELRRFAQKFGVSALVDRNGKRFADLGLRSAALSDERWLERLADDPLLLRTPLVRCQQRLTVGSAEATWKEWVTA